PNPSELLSSTRANDILATLQEQADTVLVDCPPVLPVTDSAVLSSRMDGTLLVVTAGSSTRKQVGRAVEILRQVNAPLVGTVLNDAPPEPSYGYPYYYQPREGAPSDVLRPAGEASTQPNGQPTTARRATDAPSR
ncbi:MAG TPA: hypothetical protein VG455_15875, partial [Acidimicrobiales bacterium]|nr:hypothetical protein [Acidimicrobiales bacterium]